MPGGAGRLCSHRGPGEDIRHDLLESRAQAGTASRSGLGPGAGDWADAEAHARTCGAARGDGRGNPQRRNVDPAGAVEPIAQRARVAIEGEDPGAISLME